jgi:hypothetical protein
MSKKPDDAWDKEIVGPKLLLGEGKDEKRLLEALLKHLRIDGVQVAEYGGKDRLHKFLGTLRILPGLDRLRRLAITRDADDNFAAALQSVQNSLKQKSFASPECCGEIVDDRPDVLIFLLPDGRSQGMLEK